jgi:hypothetical protein
MIILADSCTVSKHGPGQQATKSGKGHSPNASSISPKRAKNAGKDAVKMAPNTIE